MCRIVEEARGSNITLNSASGLNVGGLYYFISSVELVDSHELSADSIQIISHRHIQRRPKMILGAILGLSMLTRRGTVV